MSLDLFQYLHLKIIKILIILCILVPFLFQNIKKRKKTFSFCHIHDTVIVERYISSRVFRYKA